MAEFDPPPILADLTRAVSEMTNAVESAVRLINGIADRVQAAVDKALLNGATAEELAPVRAEITALHDGARVLSEAVMANTPQVEPPPPPPPPVEPPVEPPAEPPVEGGGSERFGGRRR